MIRTLCITLLAAIASCFPISKARLTKTFQDTEHRFQDHTGFVLYDLEKRATVFSYNGEKYFIPASNTKIFTLYAGLTFLGDSIPGLYYISRGDSLIFWGSGDPSFLYESVVPSARVYDFLAGERRDLYFSAQNFSSTAFGPGWAWSDYRYSFSSERSALPVFGNTYKVTQRESGLRVLPASFKKYFWLADSTARPNIIRDLGSNRTDYLPGRDPALNQVWKVPFKADPLVISNILEDTLKRRVTLVDIPIPSSKEIIYSVPADSLYKVMMQESDNFIAEQLLLVCSGMLSDTLRSEITINRLKEGALADLPDNPVWVDGSGLSRYNLFTPRCIVKLWEKLYDQVERERLFSLLAIGGKAGTIKNLYANEPPYIYGKTGTLSNNHNLSGYLVTRKGKTLIFCFMNNNYTVPVSEIRNQMENVLRSIYENY